MRKVVIAGLVLLALPPWARGQEFRATVNGTITDSSKAALPGAQVAVQNVETAERTTGASNAEGRYAIPFLKPGAYVLSVEAQGFKKYIRRLVLTVSQIATVDVELALGNVSEEVAVVADAPLLDVSKADRGTVIDNQRVNELPLNARNPFMLSTLVAGVNFNGPAIYQRPFDNGAIADWSINGGANRQNEFLLDGSPNNALVNGNNIAYVPPVDAVQEFKIMTNSYDAQYGRTNGGIVNVSLKSGTNTLHGTVYEYARRTGLDANLLILNAQSKPRTPHYLDQYGVELDGPLRIPGLYDGRGKTFFLFQFEGYREGTPRPLVSSVPTEAMRRGDFSNYRDAAGNLITIHDPATGHDESGVWVREPFPGNVIPPDRISPIAQKILAFYPLPNTRTPGSPDWQNNLGFLDHVARDRFHNLVGRIDHVFPGGDRVFAHFGYNLRDEFRNLNAIPEGPAQFGFSPQERVNHNAVVDWVHLFSPTTLFNIRAGFTRYDESYRSDAGRHFDQSRLGFLPAFLAIVPTKDLFPRISLSNFATMGLGSIAELPSAVVSLQPNVSLFKGAHSLRFGGDLRVSRYQEIDGQTSFSLGFDRSFTRAQFDRGDALSGSSVASLLLGAPSDGAIDVNATPSFRWSYAAPWIQDDWKVSRKWTLNLGLRWDLSTPPHEENDKMNSIFDTAAVNPANARIDRTLYPDLALRGGLRFVAVDGNPRTAWKLDKDNIQLRFGAAYQLDEATVLRGGYGRYFLNPTDNGWRQGFDLQTTLLASPDGGRTSYHRIANPFPQGVTPPPGSSKGLETYLGRDVGWSNPDYKVPHADQWSIGFERKLPWQVVLEMSYVGSRTRGEPDAWDGLNEPSLAFRNRCDPTLGGSAAYCDERVPNPFQGVAGFEGTNLYVNPTISRYDLNRPFPQFGTITSDLLNEGKIWYDSLQVVLRKRPTHGLSLDGTYTYVPRFDEELHYIDGVARLKNRSPYYGNRKHRLTASWVWQLPFGRGKRFASKAGGVLERIIGGWEVAGAWIYESGQPWGLPSDLELVKDPSVPVKLKDGQFITGLRPCVAQLDLDTHRYQLTDNAVAGGCAEPFFLVREGYQTRRTMWYDDRLRMPSYRQFDVNFAKTTRISERVKLQIRLEAYNLFNTPMYNEVGYETDWTSADFGRINKNTTQQSNFPRFLQLAAKIIF